MAVFRVLEPEGVLVIELFLLVMLDGKLEHTAADLGGRNCCEKKHLYVSIYNEEKRLLIDYYCRAGAS